MTCRGTRQCLLTTEAVLDLSPPPLEPDPAGGAGGGVVGQVDTVAVAERRPAAAHVVLAVADVRRRVHHAVTR